MKEQKEDRRRQRRWRGLATLTASLLTMSLVVAPIVEGFRTDIDKFIGTSSTRLIIEGDEKPEDLYTYQTDYANTTELVQAIEDLGERMNEEGSVLLKNNGALPLTAEETKQVSLLGFSSYYPVMGGDMGSQLTPNTGTDADTVDFVQALEAKGFTLNQTLKDLYASDAVFESWIGESKTISISAPYVTDVFTSKEPPQAVLDKIDAGWKNSLKDYPVMLVTLARSSGENRSYKPGAEGVNPEQNLNQTDPLGLSDDERDLIAAAAAAKAKNGGKIVVVLNNANPMEIEEIKENEAVDAILQVGLPGGYGFYGVADILSGETNPSGHLTDTYAVVNANAPSAANYGEFPWTNGNEDNLMNSTLVEAESIYIGYKYYETRYMDCVLGQGNAKASAGSSKGDTWNYADEVSYPFGYGLSYTTFEQSLDSLQVNLQEKTVTAEVTVKNTGAAAGKDVVQLYVSVPYTDYDREHGVEKAGIQLLDYAKTAELSPGEEQKVTITADMQNMTSWDSSSDNVAGTKGCFILDAGTYYFTVGNGVHEAANHVLAAMGQEPDALDGAGNAGQTAAWELGALDRDSFALTKNGTAVENQLENLDLNYWMPKTVTYLSRSDWAATWPKTYDNLTATDEMLAVLDNDTYEMAEDASPDAVTFGADNGMTLADLRGVEDLNDPKWGELMDQLSLEEAMRRVAFGGVSTKYMESISSPEAVQNDGPNGIYSYSLGQYANYDAASGDPCAIAENDPNKDYMAGVMGNETVIAQTFSKELAREYGEVMGNYSLWSNLPIWWGCGSNIHRSAYNARNHEYFSEDAVLTAGQGTELVLGGKKYGCLIAPKHLAFNDTEINRIGVSVFMTEQQARENELRCFQKPFEDGKAIAAMSAFNRVGVYACNAHEGLLMNILRGEWGFAGLISEDSIPQVNYCVVKEAVMNGITMTTKTGDDTMAAVAEKWSYWTPENVSKDAALMEALKRDMTWQAYALANSNVLEGVSANSRLVKVRTWYDNLITALQVIFLLLTAGSVFMYVRSGRRTGRKITGQKEE